MWSKSCLLSAMIIYLNKTVHFSKAIGASHLPAGSSARRDIIMLSDLRGNLSLRIFIIVSLRVYGLHRPMNLGYKQQVRTECWLHIHAMNRSNPRPYPPCGDVPY